MSSMSKKRKSGKAKKTSKRIAKPRSGVDKKIAKLNEGGEVSFSSSELSEIENRCKVVHERLDEVEKIAAPITREAKSVSAKPLPEFNEAFRKAQERKKVAKTEWEATREKIHEHSGELFPDSKTGMATGGVLGKNTRRQVVLDNPDLFPVNVVERYRAEQKTLEEQEKTQVFQSARTGRVYDPEMYEQRTLENLKRAQWTIAAIERGSTIVVDPVEDLVSLLKTLEECGIISVSRSNVTETGYTLTVDVTTATTSKSESMEMPESMLAPLPETSRLAEVSKPVNETGTGFFKKASSDLSVEQKKILTDVRDASFPDKGYKFDFENSSESDQDEWHGIPVNNPDLTQS